MSSTTRCIITLADVPGRLLLQWGASPSPFKELVLARCCFLLLVRNSRVSISWN